MPFKNFPTSPRIFPTAPTPLEKDQVDCARITASTLQQILTPFCVPLVDCAAVVIQGRRREFGQRPAVPGEVQGDQTIDARAYHQCHPWVLTTKKYR